jgi:hypothetical protein
MMETKVPIHVARRRTSRARAAVANAMSSDGWGGSEDASADDGSYGGMSDGEACGDEGGSTTPWKVGAGASSCPEGPEGVGGAAARA